jgi:hypothetical protein
MSVHRSTAVALSMLSTLAACRGSLGPEQMAGTYVLERVGSDPMPAVILREEQALVRVIADTLRLDADGGGSFVSLQRIELANPDAAPRAASRIESALTVRVVDARIEMSFVCPINASCAAGPHLIGRVDRGGLRVEDMLVTGAPRYYRRIEDSAVR